MESNTINIKRYICIYISAMLFHLVYKEFARTEKDLKANQVVSTKATTVKIESDKIYKERQFLHILL